MWYDVMQVGCTALMLAAKGGHLGMVQWLLSGEGADLEAKDRVRPAQCAVQCGMQHVAHERCVERARCGVYACNRERVPEGWA